MKKNIYEELKNKTELTMDDLSNVVGGAGNPAKEERLYTLFAQRLGIPRANITKASIIIDDLGADSLDVVDIVSAVEDEFRVR